MHGLDAMPPETEVLESRGESNSLRCPGVGTKLQKSHRLSSAGGQLLFRKAQRFHGSAGNHSCAGRI